jgi:lysophospholipase L1-like esterase
MLDSRLFGFLIGGTLLLATAAHAQAPVADWAKLARYAATNQRLPAPTAARPRVVLMGNSITDFWPKTDSAFFVGNAYEYVGRGISGQVSGQMLLRLWPDVIALQPKVVVILSGANDIAENGGPYSPEATLHNIMAMTELARAHGIRVVLCSVLPAYDFWWRKDLQPAPKILALNRQIKAYAAQQRLVYLDYHAAMADTRQGLPATLAPDGVHPNLAGYRVMEPLLLKATAEALRRK